MFQNGCQVQLFRILINASHRANRCITLVHVVGNKDFKYKLFRLLRISPPSALKEDSLVLVYYLLTNIFPKTV